MGKDKQYVFWFHYNKPNEMISVHYRNKCYITSDLVCNVPIASKFNKNQPKFTMKGKCKNFNLTPKGIEIS